ncbi:hypothetical protein FGADI_289 [Fusarium gaditjirri]|uniref:Uncharacterized protein n=1 Tax=Fusarium gaditjirri TaxID=282569 RepID=A0A8H4TNV6_9HYPO|nr:hypothetical protein FGADI_289 [Fusarium gaditjirri]
MELSNTLEQDQLETLWRLFSRMIIFIEDYVSKATSVYLPRAYLGIPDILNGSRSYFKGQRLDPEAVSLVKKERRRYNRPLVNCDELGGGEPREEQGGTSSGDDQLPIYRQRARGLFDNDRLYPKYGHHFPKLDELAGPMRELRKTLAPNVERSRRRSQKWQDYWVLRILEPPDQQFSERDDVASTKGHLGPCVRFFEALSRKLPIL